MLIKPCYTFNKIHIFRERFQVYLIKNIIFIKTFFFLYKIAKEFLNVASYLLYNSYDIDLRLRERTMIVSS